MNNIRNSLGGIIISSTIFFVFIIQKASAQKKQAKDKPVEEVAKAPVVGVTKRKFAIGEPVVIDVNLGGVVDGDVKFKCRIYVRKEDEWVEIIPSLEATMPKEIDPVYTFPNTRKLVWNHKNKPKYFQPKVGVEYIVVIELEEEKPSRRFGSLPFKFGDLANK
ncbi:MAG: hypothetical protein ACJAQT_004956 [Akkermansiaceae bacterium]|jgi:hypothetical protein